MKKVGEISTHGRPSEVKFNPPIEDSLAWASGVAVDMRVAIGHEAMRQAYETRRQIEASRVYLRQLTEKQGESQ